MPSNLDIHRDAWVFQFNIGNIEDIEILIRALNFELVTDVQWNFALHNMANGEYSRIEIGDRILYKDGKLIVIPKDGDMDGI